MDTKSKILRLIGRLSEEELQVVWTVLAELYADFYMLRAVDIARESFKPGDSLTREEAVRFLQE